MNDSPIELVCGGGNVFRDFGYADADARQAKFSRFTIDRLMSIFGLLDQNLEVSVTVHPRGRPEPAGDTLHP